MALYLRFISSIANNEIFSFEIILDLDRNIYLAGVFIGSNLILYTDTFPNLGSGGSSFFLCAFDSVANFKWAYATDSAFNKSIALSQSKNVLITNSIIHQFIYPAIVQLPPF